MTRTVAVNGKWLSHALTGTERYAGEILRAWCARGADLELIVPRDAVLPDWVRGVRVRRSRFRGQLFEQVVLPLTTVGRTLVSMGGPAPLLKRRQVVVLHDASVFVVPGSYSRRFVTWYRVMMRAVSRGGARLVTVSAFSAGELAGALRLPPDRFTVVPGAGSHLRTAEEAAPPQEVPERFALFLGTPAPHKNIGPMLAAFAEAEIPTVVVGAASRTDIFGFGASGARPGSVVSVGRVDDRAVVWLLRRATALVFPSRYEGFGLPVIEAQEVGCAVVASSAAAMPEVGGDGALYFDPARPGDAVAQFQRLADAATREDLVDRGARNARRFDWEASADALARIAGVPLRERS
ncbi:MAG: glycosyltransferase family 4 protein [Curtobacterium sp.]